MSPLPQINDTKENRRSPIVEENPRRKTIEESSPAQTSMDRKTTLKLLFTFGVAIAVDALQIIVPPEWLFLDIFAAVVFLATWGLRWEVALVIVPEVIPGLDLFPTWIAFAFYLWQRAKSIQPDLPR